MNDVKESWGVIKRIVKESLKAEWTIEAAGTNVSVILWNVLNAHIADDLIELLKSWSSLQVFFIQGFCTN